MKIKSRKSLIAFSVVILGFLAIVNGIALTLNDMPNEGTFGPQVKTLINSNNDAIEAWSAGVTNVIIVTTTIATNANGGTNVVTFTAKDLAGTAIAFPAAIRFWISDDGQGTLAAVAGDVAISAGVELQQVLDKADYWIISTNLAGTVVATITDTPGGTNYIHTLAPWGKITKVTSAFKVP